MLAFKSPLSHINPKPLDSLAPSQSHSLAVLLQLGNQLITLLDHVRVLFILVIWTVRLDDTLSSNAVNRTVYPLCSNELGKITGKINKYFVV